MVRSGAVGVLLADSGSPSFPPGEAALRGERPWSALRGSAACRGRREAGLEAGVEAGGAEWRPLGCPAAGEATRGPKQGSAGAGQRLRVFPHEGQNRCSQFPVLQGISNHFGLSGGREEAGRRPGGQGLLSQSEPALTCFPWCICLAFCFKDSKEAKNVV